MTPNLSFSACLAENPGALKIENPEFSAQNARSYPYPARLAPLHKIAPIRLFAQGDQAYCAEFTFDRRLKRLKTKPVRGNATFNRISALTQDDIRLQETIKSSTIGPGICREYPRFVRCTSKELTQ